MTETSRIKAINEIKRKLDEREKLIEIYNRLSEFEEEGRWEEYLDCLIQWQSFLIKFKNKYGNEPKEMVGLYQDISIPSYDGIVNSTFIKYADNSNPIYFYPALYGYENGSRMEGYKSLENENSDYSAYEYNNRKLNNTFMTLKLSNTEANYYLYQKWFFRLLMDHNMEEAYEILKRVCECDNSVYNRTLSSGYSKSLIRK